MQVILGDTELQLRRVRPASSKESKSVKHCCETSWLVLIYNNNEADVDILLASEVLEARDPIITSTLFLQTSNFTYFSSWDRSDVPSG